MKKLIYFSLLIVGLSALSCREIPPIVNPTVHITIDGTATSDEMSLPQFDTLKLDAVVDNATDYLTIWSIDDKQVSLDRQFLYIATDLGRHTIKLTINNADGGTSTCQTTIDVHGRYKHGAIVLNEGNMSAENGSLIFIDPKGRLTDSLYWRVNGSYLGNSSQDLHIDQGNIYIISQNGDKLGGDGQLVVANAATMQKVAAYNEELSTLSWPTNISVVGDNAYIRDGKGVHLFDLSTKTLTLIEGSVGAAGNRMAVVGAKVFVPAGKNIFVVEGDKIIHTIQMSGTVSGVIGSWDGNLYVSCNTTPAQINKISPADYSILQTNEITEAAVGAGYGKMPGISAKGDTIYFSNATTKIYRHIFSSKQTTFLTDVKDHIADAEIVYNSLSVDPISGLVYFNTIKGYGDYKINDLSVFDFSGTTAVLKADYKNYTRFPAGVYFTANF